MKQSTRYTITVLDQTFTLISDESQQRIEAVTALVNSVMTNLSASISGAHSLLATMAALTVANDLIAERDKNAACITLIEHLIASIDEALGTSE